MHTRTIHTVRLTSVAAVCAALILGGCGTLKSSSYAGDLPRTPGEAASGFGYVPLDPLPVRYTGKAKEAHTSSDAATGNAATGEAAAGDAASGPPAQTTLTVLDSLPDVSVRFAVADLQAGGGLNFGVVKSTLKGQYYRAILDYVNVDVVPVPFLISKLEQNVAGVRTVRLTETPSNANPVIVGYQVTSVSPNSMIGDDQRANATLVTIPVYVGIGLRLTADIRALKSDINLTGLSAIGVEAESNALTGTLTVQTLGVNGSPIATTVPLPNKLDQTTIENAILAVGGIRATLYTANGSGSDGPGTVGAQPRIVGLYSPVGTDPLLINAIYAELSNNPPTWPNPMLANN